MTAIDKLIITSLSELSKLACIKDTVQTSKSKLVFPVKRDEKRTRRVSEQEARFLLVQQLEKSEQTKYQYAVEAPTMQTYRFKGKGRRSGNIDLCIYENGKRTSLIEFKALNPSENSAVFCFEVPAKKLQKSVGLQYE
jgi:hypothetical protein